MASDDERISYLEGNDIDFGASTEPGLANLRGMLDEPAIWEQPSPTLEAAIVDAVRAEAGDDVNARPVVPAPGRIRRHRRMRWIGGAVAAAAAAVVVVLLISPIDPDSDDEQLAASLTDAEVPPDVTGDATFTQTDSGWEIELDAPELPRLDDGQYYQAWLKSADDVTVPIGTFNEGDDVVLWAGVSPRDFPTITVTSERDDGDQTSSGIVVLSGEVTGG